MALDFFEMMKQEQEKQKTQNALATKQNKELHPVTPKTEEKQPETKKEVKNDKLNALTFDEQLKKVDPQAKAIVKYLLLKYPDIKEKMEHPDVSIEGMYSYIQSQARKHAKNGSFITVPQELIDAFPEDAKKEGYLSDNIVYGWGRHYYDEHGKVA